MASHGDPYIHSGGAYRLKIGQPTVKHRAAHKGKIRLKTAPKIGPYIGHPIWFAVPPIWFAAPVWFVVPPNLYQ